MMTKSSKFQILSLLLHSLIVLSLGLHILADLLLAAKVLDIDDKLPELIEKHPEKSWLIKFYAPWCHHCRQLEPTYNNVAESIYNKHNDLVVGRVDCTKTGSVCGKYNVDAYPSIIYIDKESQVKYRGDRGEQSIITFAERLRGPTINNVKDCQALTQAVNKHGLVILSTISEESDVIKKEFESLASTYKSSYWFYQYFGTCEKYQPLDRGSLYVLKRHSDRPIKFEHKEKPLPDESDLKDVIINWLNKVSFPIYGQITHVNIERALETGKLLVMAILDEYKPARRFSSTSREFHKRFEEIAKRYAEDDDQLLFGWTSDLDLIQYVTITPVSTPNVIILKPDFGFHLFVSDATSSNKEDKSKADKLDNELLEKLGQRHIESLISQAKEGKLEFSGGSSFLFSLMRHAMSTLNRFVNMYKANPLLIALLFGFPTLIVMFVIYTTCIYDAPERNEEDEEDLDDDDEEDNGGENDGDEEDQHLWANGHLKQD